MEIKFIINIVIDYFNKNNLAFFFFLFEGKTGFILFKPLYDSVNLIRII